MPKISAAAGPTNAADPVAAPETADRTYAPMTDDELAERAYGAYCEARGWRSVNGDDLPNWEDQDDDLKSAWRAAVREVRGDILEPGGRRPTKVRPRDDGDDDPGSGEGFDLDDDSTRIINDDLGQPYPDGGSAAAVESWVAGNSDRAAYALDREDPVNGGQGRAGLTATLRKLVPADGG